MVDAPWVDPKRSAQLHRVGLGEVRAQQISTLAPADLLEFLAVEPVGEYGAVFIDIDERRAPGTLLRALPSFINSSSRVSVMPCSCARRAHSHFSCRRRIERSLAMRSAFSAKT